MKIDHAEQHGKLDDSTQSWLLFYFKKWKGRGMSKNCNLKSWLDIVPSAHVIGVIIIFFDLRLK